MHASSLTASQHATTIKTKTLNEPENIMRFINYQLTFILTFSEKVALIVLVIRCSRALKAIKSSQNIKN